MSAQNPDLLHITLLTVSTSICATLFSCPFAILLAWLLEKKQWLGKSVIEAFTNLPIAIPPVATGLILLELFGNRGILGSWFLSLGIEMAFTWRAIAIACAVISFPLFVRTIRLGFSHVPTEMENAARTLGASEIVVFFRVTLPLAAQSVFYGASMAFICSLGEFGAVAMFAGYIPGKTDTLSLSIYNAVQLGKDHQAFKLLTISLLLAFFCLWGCELFFKNKLNSSDS